MHFCSQCKNMYYLKISDEEGESENMLIYYCRNCGHEDKNITAENVCVSETQLRRSEKKYSQMVNEYTKYDPTLPRINTIKCPNHECISNNAAGGEGQAGGGRPTKAEAAAKAAAKAEAEASGVPLPAKAAPKTTKLKQTAEQKEKIQKAMETMEKKKASSASAAQPQAMEKKKATQASAATQAQASAATQASAQQKEEEALAQVMEEQSQEEEELEEAAKTYLASKTKATAASTMGPISTGHDNNNREIIYLRYDDINMKYIYLCVHCNTVWKTDNRQ